MRKTSFLTFFSDSPWAMRTVYQALVRLVKSYFREIIFTCYPQPCGNLLDSSGLVCHTGPMENPIRRIRLSKGRTLMEFAGDCGVNYQALYLNECGVYPSILPAIHEYLVSLDAWPTDLNEDYEEFRYHKRVLFGDIHSATPLPPPVGTLHPFIAFRHALKLSRAAVAKKLCVHPAGLYRLELGLMKHLPGDVREAMLVAGFPGSLVDELDYRVEEWNSGAWERAAS